MRTRTLRTLVVLPAAVGLLALGAGSAQADTRDSQRGTDTRSAGVIDEDGIRIPEVIPGVPSIGILPLSLPELPVTPTVPLPPLPGA
ncbi:hypothetical protein [Streptomyces oceani]|uniref:Secreted protein n=1 Tax=Streptomyces oceani TaxID=1075402 RepID=A0A1E7KI15_9ACTN|nr:hypothetical protein [Streptomyces oceani]OEV03557.1 hypothetical protein AN216_10855 [Streptomyces oceani]